MTALEPPPFRLTELTDCGGCAAKLGADLLAEALAGLGAESAATASSDLIAGLNPPDDAAAYRVSDDLAIIGTLDFFPPLVDDPRTFGEIAAANALSDVFAMGGRVLFALSIAAFPEDLPREVLTEIFAGASAKVREAGGTLAGGHTIRDPEPKYGLAVIGAAHPDKLLRKGGARPGDRLVLTKPLGTGILVSGHRQGKTGEADLATAIDGMRRLNRAASEALVAAGDPDRHRCHRFRTAGARAGDGPRVGGVLRLRGSGPAGTPRGARGGRCRGRDRRRGAQPSLRGGLVPRPPTASRRRSSRSRMTRRHRAASSPPSRRSTSPRSTPPSTQPVSSAGGSAPSSPEVRASG